MLIDSDSTAVGWLIRLFNSARSGRSSPCCSASGDHSRPAISIGLAYGVLWWTLGALLIMPAWLDMNDMIFELKATAWRSLLGHLLYGLLLSAVFALAPTHPPGLRRCGGVARTGGGRMNP